MKFLDNVRVRFGFLGWIAGTIVIAASGSLVRPAGPNSAQPSRPVTAAQIEAWMQELSNWGRWGEEDQLGALNLITPEKRKQAAALVREGVCVSLAREVAKQAELDNPNPLEQIMTFRSPWNIDTYRILYHGYAHTHLDALCHMVFQGKMYNGFSSEEVTSSGAARLAIARLKEGIFTRGILLDIPLLKGVSYLEPGQAIYPEDLEAWEERAGIRVGSGDVVFVRTGRWARRLEKGPWDVSAKAAGLHASCARWFRERDVAAVGSDAAADVLPSEIEGVSHPLHQLLLIAMGVHIFDNCDLEALSQAAQERERWEFLLTAAPLAVPGGTGSPLNPIATF